MRLDERICAAVLPVAYRLTGREHMQMLADSLPNQYLDAERLRELQMSRLGALLDHAYRTVPYYERLFRSAGAEPGDITSLDDYAHLPVLTKEAVREYCDELISTGFDRAELVENSTGGSTGSPTRFYQDRRYCEMGSAVFLRNLEWTGYHQGERQIWFFGVPKPETVPAQTRLQRFLLRRTVFSVFDLSDETMARWLGAVLRVQPRLLYGYPTALARFAAYARDSGIRLDSVRQAVASSETLSPQDRTLIAEALDVEVFDQYGSKEVYSIAAQCRHGSMHINSDINLVELVSLSAEAGQRGVRDIVVTPLFAWGMPLLRYAIGDYGLPREGGCECGMTLPLMESHLGRALDVFRLGDGRVVHGFGFIPLVRTVPGVQRFQFRQKARDTIELLVVPGARFDRASMQALADVERRIEKELGICVQVPVRIVDDIPLTSQGKHRFIVSELGGERVAHNIEGGACEGPDAS